ncbi:PQQ-dependent sugar dehydrogenase [Alteromonas sp. ASW11-130]|uniref:PQQ-dependent sugar dehydrogenase n=1 Tax=Alteromonas sp. ASW11-130 TaxID=3015775 RepID=UPI0022425DE0|nr:PQQ-dependent sugar dehydrogenase [Alteromonas sp. ASW11-130]MCW8090856.1 PQQ-dependent sugar dehydrogenase [Alteromonas sp. ASW11-130]
MNTTTTFGRIAALTLLVGSSSAHAADSVNLQVNELASGLNHPWGMTFLPDNRLVITERGGSIQIYDAKNGLSGNLEGVPDVAANNQGGMLDILADPDFANNHTLYFCYSKPGDGGSSSAVRRAKLEGEKLVNGEDIFIAKPLIDNGFHFGCRLGFDAQKNLYITLGDRYKYMQEAQNPDNHYGTIVRVRADGSVPEDNPFTEGKAPEVFSYGHRNVQGLTVHPKTGDIWAMEHGPKGGDEVNKLGKGKNYGWPVITYGVDYSGEIISDKTEQEGMEQPVIYWDPSIAPSGMTFYYGDKFKEWEGDLLVGALKFTHLRRIEMDGDNPGKEHEYLRDRNQRIRDVEVGPDGLIYLLTDEANGKLLQVSPKG